MKFFAIGLISAIFASSCNAASMGNLRSLDVENCRFHNAAGECTECIFRYILDDGACRAVSDQCKTWNATSGDCESCFDGWSLQNGACVVGGGEEPPTEEPPTEEPPTEEPPTEEPPTEEPPTEEPSGDCNFRQVRIDGVCVDVSDQCNTWDATTGACTSCYGGYTLSNGACVVGGGEEPPTEEPPTEEPPTEEPPTEEPPTEEPSGECYFRQVRIDGACVNVSDQCNTWNETTGACTSCYGGYTLSNGACVV